MDKYIGNDRIQLIFTPWKEGYKLSLYLRDKERLKLVAESGSIPAFIVFTSPVRFSGGDIKEVKVKRDSAEIFSYFQDFYGNRWEVEGKIKFIPLNEIQLFLYDINFIYKGKKPSYFLSVEFWMRLNSRKKPFYLIPGIIYYYPGKVDWFKENKFDRESFYVPEYASSLYCSYPLSFFWWNGTNYCFMLEKPKGKICQCFGIGKKGKSYYAGVAFPHRGKEEFYEEGILPLKAFPGKNFKLRFYQSAQISKKLHSYSSYLKFWYFNFGEHGKYNRWCGVEKLGRLLSKGFKYHYDRELKILRDVVHFSGKPTFLHRGMTNGWTSGAMSAYHMLRLGFYLNDKELINGAIGVLDNISSALTPSGFYYSFFDDVDRKWKEGAEWWGRGPEGKIAGTPISETTFFMLVAYRWLKEERGIEKRKWLESAISNLETLCRNNPDGIFGMYYDPYTGKKDIKETRWNRPWSFSMDWVASLSMGYRLIGKRIFIKLAKKAADYYYKKIFSCGSLLLDPIDTSDSTTLDESASHALRGYMELYFATEEEKYLNYAVDLAYYACSYKFAWNVPIEKGTYLEKENYKTIGFSKHHYGLQNVEYLLHLWKLTKEEYFLKVAIDVLHSAPQPICRYDGEQGGKAGMCCEGVYLWSKSNFSLFGPKCKAWGQIRERISHIGDISWITHAFLVLHDFKDILRMKI